MLGRELFLDSRVVHRKRHVEFCFKFGHFDRRGAGRDGDNDRRHRLSCRRIFVSRPCRHDVLYIRQLRSDR